MLKKVQKLNGALSWAAGICGLVISLALPICVPAQIDALFDASAAIGTVRHEFRLSSRDIKVLKPLITRESSSLVHILSDCKDAGDFDYMRLWNKVLISRREFEAETPQGLAPRQRAALRTVRSKFETLVLGQWVDDHIQQLGEELELDWIQFNLVAKIFDTESQKRLKLLTGKSSNNAELDLKWQALTAEREKSLQQVLTPQQLQDYLDLTRPTDKLLS